MAEKHKTDYAEYATISDLNRNVTVKWYIMNNSNKRFSHKTTELAFKKTQPVWKYKNNSVLLKRFKYTLFYKQFTNLAILNIFDESSFLN